MNKLFIPRLVCSNRTKFYLLFWPAPRQKKASGSPKKKGKKKNPWSDDSEVSDVSEISDNDMDGSFLGTYIPREVSRRAAGEYAD